MIKIFIACESGQKIKNFLRRNNESSANWFCMFFVWLYCFRHAANYKIMQFATSENQIVNKTKITNKIDILKRFSSQNSRTIDFEYWLKCSLWIICKHINIFAQFLSICISNFSYWYTIFDLWIFTCPQQTILPLLVLVK